MRRMRIKQTHPKIAFDLFNLAEERNQCRAARGINRLTRAGFFRPQIHSVVRRVLANQIKFTHAFCDQAADLRQHRVHRPAAMFAAHLWNHAETARMIATLGNFHISRMRGSQSKPRRVVIGNVSWPRICKRKIDILLPHDFLNDRAKFFDLIQANKGVDFRHFLAQFARKSL